MFAISGVLNRFIVSTGTFMVLSMLSTLIPLSLRGATCEKGFAKVFETSFFDKTVYKKALCQDNACRLLNRLDQAGESLKNTSVIYFMGLLVPTTPRDIFAQWPYHTFVIHKGQVLDLDFGPNPNILPLPEYLRAQWIPKEFDTDIRVRNYIANNVRVVEVPAVEYLKNYPLDNTSSEVMNKFIQKTIKKKPIKSLTEYFESLPK